MARRKPPLRERHADRGATFTEFGGWDMPVEFDSIREEHAAVRERAGIFDVSHMGELVVTGPDAEELMQRLTTNDVTRLSPGRSQYAAITDESGVMLDDTVVYDRPDAEGYLFVPNAGHDVETFDRWVAHRDEWGLDADVENVTEEFGMFAVQGPDAADHVAGAVIGDGDPTDLSRFEAVSTALAGVDCLVARTGYTGEDGFELVVPWDGAETVWEAFAAEGVQPCGLGARDTLRMEMGYLLSGQDFHPEEEPRTPYEADIGFVVALDTDFVGRDALAAQRERGVDERLVGLKLLDRGVPRHGYEVTGDGDNLGTVTSGTMSPTLNEPIALTYLPTGYTDPGTEVAVVVRGTEKRARVTPLPFIDR